MGGSSDDIDVDIDYNDFDKHNDDVYVDDDSVYDIDLHDVLTRRGLTRRFDTEPLRNRRDAWVKDNGVRRANRTNGERVVRSRLRSHGCTYQQEGDARL